MKSKDQILLEEAYNKILLKEESVLISRRSKEEREKNFKIAILRKIQEYVKNGSKGDLILNNSPITSLPEGLSVGRDLNLSHTPITSLPQGLSVNGDLGLDFTAITSLPKGLSVGGDLYLRQTKITSLPEDLEVRGKIYK
jgi:hypothetical protein